MTDERSRGAVEVGERHADGCVSTDEAEAAWARAEEVYEADDYGSAAFAAASYLLSRRATATSIVSAEAVYDDAASERERAESGERAAQAGLLRCICGNPFRPPQSLSPSLLGWSDGLVVKLAEAAYQHRSLPSGHRDPDRLAVLADALTDAGCTDDRLLGHLRSEGPHVRGCFAVDAVLGRS